MIATKQLEFEFETWNLSWSNPFVKRYARAPIKSRIISDSNNFAYCDRTCILGGYSGYWRLNITHDDVIKWKHFRRYCPLNPAVTGGFPSQRPVTRSFDFDLDLCLNNGWANSYDAGDLRRHRAHNDVTVMVLWSHEDLFEDRVPVKFVGIGIESQ